MKAVEGIYENGKVILSAHPKVKRKYRILVYFLMTRKKKTNKKHFPTGDLGKILNLDRQNIYEEFLSDRY